jgi:calcium-translocating P-type ATPase
MPVQGGAESMTPMALRSTAPVVEAAAAPASRYPDGSIDAPHAAPAEALCELLGVDTSRGLSAAAAAELLASYGPNRPRPVRRPPYARLVLRQFVDPLVALLVGAATVSVLVGEGIEAAAIAVVIVLNAVLGFSQELGAERAIRSLSAGFTRRAVVLRGGREEDVPAEDVVPGDLLVLREGERVAADARVLETSGLEADESPLTGESLPVAKQPQPVPAQTPLAERSSMVFAATGVTRGRATALVTATGASTELGGVERLSATTKPPPTPLQRRLGRLARQMVVVGVLLTLALAGVMLLRGAAVHDAFLVGVAVAVAAVPEGLVATVTAALALGAHAMAHKGAIVRRLDSIETVGEATVVCTDKTGTLTENRIRVSALRPARGRSEMDLLAAAVLASTAELAAGSETVLGDPVEGALLLAAMERGITRADLLAERRQVHALPFDSNRRRMGVVYDEPDGRRLVEKGAPELLVARSEQADPELERIATDWAAEGFRVLAVADRRVRREEPLDETLESELRLLGVVALHDPLRATAAGAVSEARAAGVAVRMVTGDHPATARTIGHALGLPPEAIHARLTPSDKLSLVEELQRGGDVVAVTGDGVNDAPALRRADVGIAMGERGTEAARESAAIVLTDDDFATIVEAIREGRRIGDNIRHFVAFLLSANLGEVFVFAVAIGAGLGVPLAVIQVLLVNLVTDGLPAFALAHDPASAGTMRRGPRAGGQLFDRPAWLDLAGIGLLVGSTALAAYGLGRSSGEETAQTMAYATIALSELALVFTMRSRRQAAWRLPRNAWLETSVLGSALLVAATLYVPALRDALRTVQLDAARALAVVGIALVPALAVEAVKARRRAVGDS